MAPEEPETVEHNESDGEKEVPVCLQCLEPVDPMHHYCPNCGEATGWFTHYIPFVNIPWQTRTWGRMWRQIWSGEVSLAGRLFRLFMIVWNVPVMLVGLIPVFWESLQRHKSEQNINPNQDLP